MSVIKAENLSASDEDDQNEFKDADDVSEFDPEEFFYSSDESVADELFEETRLVVEEINRILNTKSDSIKEEGISLNREMQHQINNWKSMIKTIIKKASQELKVLGKKKNAKRVKKTAICLRTSKRDVPGGSTFFRDENLNSCPNNDDYKERLENDEWFPMDLNLKQRHLWSKTDKTNVFLGVKEQALVHLSYKDRKERGPKNERNFRKYKMQSLMEQLDETFQIDWLEISIHNVQSRHSPESCKAIWDMYLRPDLTKQYLWNEEKTQLLVETANRYNKQNWKAIADELGLNYSEYQCFVQYRSDARMPRNKRFTKLDDAKLIATVEKCTVNGIVNWNLVCAQFPDRSKQHVRQRYRASIDPKIAHRPFTAEEDIALLSLVEKYGEKFSNIPRIYFPDRSIVQLRTHYLLSLKFRGKQADWDLHDDRRLVEFVKQNGFSWKKCENELFQGRHSRISCRARYMLIQRYLDMDENATLESVPRRSLKETRKKRVNTENWIKKVKDVLETDENIKQERSESPSNGIEIVEKSSCSKKSAAPKKRKKQPNMLNPKNLQIALSRKRKWRSKRDSSVPKPKRVRVTKKPVYVDRLRAVGLKLYNVVKYSYNFKFGVEENFTSQLEDLRVLQETANALQFSLPSRRCVEIDAHNLPGFVYQRISKMMYKAPRPVDFQNINLIDMPSLPPSYSTALGLRSLCILYSQTKNQATNRPSLLEKYGHHSAVKMLKERMRILFFETCLFSRIQSSDDVIKSRLLKAMGKAGESSVKCDNPIEETPSTSKVIIKTLDEEESDFDLSGHDEFEEISKNKTGSPVNDNSLKGEMPTSGLDLSNIKRDISPVEDFEQELFNEFIEECNDDEEDIKPIITTTTTTTTTEAVETSVVATGNSEQVAYSRSGLHLINISNGSKTLFIRVDQQNESE